jgi:riboflavin kinase/FMN adenylyltransferase
MTQVEEQLAVIKPERHMMLTVGVFDGVHIGHKYLIAQLKEQARRRGLASGIVTFRQHPEEVVLSKCPMPLTDISCKIELLKKEGVDYLIPLSFTSEVACLSAREFVLLLQKHLRMKGMVVGYDFSLGRNREGDYDMLCRLGEEMGFDVVEAYCRRLEGEIVSSTVIRKALARGDKERALNMLGWDKEVEIVRSCIR